MKNIKLIALNTFRELLSMKMLYLLVFLILFVILANGFMLSNLIDQLPQLDEATARSQQASLISSLYNPWTTFTILFGIIFGAGSVYWEKKNKTVVGIMAKPVSRPEFLLGKVTGVLMMVLAFMLTGALLISILMLVWDIPFTGLYVSGIVINLAQLTVYTALSFVLSLYITPVVGGAVSFILWSFAELFQAMIGSENLVVKGLGYFLFYINPAQVGDPLIQWGILNNVIDPEMGLYWSVIGENLLYTVVVLFLGILLYRKKDIVMG